MQQYTKQTTNTTQQRTGLCIETRIEQIKEEYYTLNNKRSVFGKNEQKNEIAQNVCENVGIEDMMKHTLWIVPYSNCVYFDYHMFKMFAHTNNYTIIVNEVMNLCKQCIHTFGSFSVHVNLLGFSISAAERYKGIIEMFCNQCLANNENYSDYLEYINVYNTPQFIENISRIMGTLIPPNVKSKVLKIGKKESENALHTLFYGNKEKHIQQHTHQHIQQQNNV